MRSVKLIGDAAAPGPIAWATYAGRRYAEELDEPDRGDALSFPARDCGASALRMLAHTLWTDWVTVEFWSPMG